MIFIKGLIIEGEITNRIRVAQTCLATNYWVEKDGNKTLWHGTPMWLLSLGNINKNLPPYEVVHENLPNPNISNGIFSSELQAVVDGIADITLKQLVQSDQLYKHVDFLVQPIKSDIVQIWYKKNSKMIGDPFRGVFDMPSYALITLDLIAFPILLWFYFKREGDSIHMKDLLLEMFGHIFGQGLSDKFNTKSQSTNAIIFLFITTSHFLRLMYLSIVTTKLIAKELGQGVDTLEQLALESHRKIIMFEGFFKHYNITPLISNLEAQHETA